jgi:hypothetical protein
VPGKLRDVALISQSRSQTCNQEWCSNLPQSTGVAAGHPSRGPDESVSGLVEPLADENEVRYLGPDGQRPLWPTTKPRGRPTVPRKVPSFSSIHEVKATARVEYRP